MFIEVLDLWVTIYLGDLDHFYNQKIIPWPLRFIIKYLFAVLL
jgi:hypothetical protein